MAFLGASVPWTGILREGAGDLERQISFELPGVDSVKVDAAGESVLVLVGGAPDPLHAAYGAAGVLARLWPSWLADLGVSLVVDCEGSIVTAGPGAMGERPDLGQALWLLACEVEGG